jgi:hypothetical protein
LSNKSSTIGSGEGSSSNLIQSLTLEFKLNIPPTGKWIT